MKVFFKHPSFATFGSWTARRIRITTFDRRSRQHRARRQYPNERSHASGRFGSALSVVVFVLACEEARIACCGDHRSVISGKRAAGEEYFEIVALRFGFKRGAQLAIRGDSAGHEDRPRTILLRRGNRARNEIIHHRALKARHQIQRRGGSIASTKPPRRAPRAPAPPCAHQSPAASRDDAASDTAPPS